jgi:vitamin B12 transporter
MNKVLSLALACLLFPASQSWSATLQTFEPIIVTATKLETPAREVASSVTVITAEEIEEKQQASVAEVLRAVPGVDIVRSGGPGEQTSIFLRGANSSQTLVLVDGIEVNDPIDPNRAFNFAFLDTYNIERVEIVRGPQSTLYGSDAMGGVVNIITSVHPETPDL